jgi:hypothetical protein
MGTQPRSYQVTLTLLAEAAGDTTFARSAQKGDTAIRSQPAVLARLPGTHYRVRVRDHAIESLMSRPHRTPARARRYEKVRR